MKNKILSISIMMLATLMANTGFSSDLGHPTHKWQDVLKGSILTKDSILDKNGNTVCMYPIGSTSNATVKFYDANNKVLQTITANENSGSSSIPFDHLQVADSDVELTTTASSTSCKMLFCARPHDDSCIAH